MIHWLYRVKMHALAGKNASQRAPFFTCKDSVYIKIKGITVKTASGYGTNRFYVGA